MIGARAWPGPWRAAALAAFVLVGAVAAWLFAPIVAGYFLADDFVPLVLFRHWQDEGELVARLASKFATGLDAGDNHFYRPLSYLTFALSYLASGTHAAPWMTLDVAVHILNGAMAGAIGVSLAEERPGARAAAAALLGAALFAFFAPGAEVAAWISGRFDLFATFFTLLACLAFVRSRRARDAAWWVSLGAAVAAFLSKESAAIVPFAIVLLAWALPAARAHATPKARAFAALRAALPWLALSALYLLWRYAMFGSATAVYGGSHPVARALSPAYWAATAQALPAWLHGLFRLRAPAALLAVLTLAQLALLAWLRRGEGRSRDVVLAVAAIVLLTIALVAPHVVDLPPSGLGGRLLYQTGAFYAVLATAGLCLARPARLLWGITIALVALHAAFMHETLGRWSAAYAQMRSLTAAVARLGASLPLGEYALVIVPAYFEDIGFGVNAQAGLMLAPVVDPPVIHRLLVQADREVPEIPAKIADGVVATLRERSLFDYMAGERVRPAQPEYPTRAVCWDAKRRDFAALDVPAGPTPEAWGKTLERALRTSPCEARWAGGAAG